MWLSNTGDRLCLCLFLSTLESTVVGTALVAITNDLGGFRSSSWIISAYLLTYTGFLTILAKLSDIFGRRTLMSLSLVTFIVFSIACGVARSIVQLIVFRAFQGIGGGGIYTMTFVILPEMVPPARYARYAGIISAVAAMSSLLGPIFGGVISDHGTWKWIFLFNGPAGFAALVLFYLTLPAHFPHSSDHDTSSKVLLGSKLRKVDFFGGFFLLSSTLLLVTAIEEGGTQFSWNSVLVLSLLIVSVVLMVGTVLWSRHQASRVTEQESILPWAVLADRYAMGLLLVCLFSGLAFITCIIVLPQQFQVVYGDSPSTAGYRLLALTLTVPVGSALAGFFSQKLKVPPLYILLAGSSFIILGTGLASSIQRSGTSFPKSQYGFQEIMGFGFGINLATVVMTAPLAFSEQNLAVGMGASNQFRVLGGSIGVSICANILNNRITDRLAGILLSSQIKALLGSAQTVALLPPVVREEVREVFATSFTQQMQAILGLSGAGLFGNAFDD
ncbi:major facilitator superfamily transporter [Zopfia rhizophila CBS 207.26]|uniref:Major facilitator superfamily transporter n=1 Tax=Zopfia rhizophila CBS 207.26 TaxID=1314779 RepID=A0A6A6DI04_9PEZI|nr:major facilitator superfamily transporter [Zopfia rhizophila CBS 207.26]